MITKVYESVKQYIKENKGFLLFALVFFIVINIPLPVYINTPGGIIPIDKRIEVEDGYTSEGSYNLSYVSELRGTIPTYLLSFVMPGWDVSAKEEVVQKNETEDDVEFQNQIFLKQSQNDAIRVAYEKAGKTVTIQDRKVYVTYLMEDIETDLKVKDQLLQVDGHDVTEVSDYISVVKEKQLGDTLYLKVLRDGTEKDCFIQVIELDGKPATGIYLVEDMKLDTDPKITFHFEQSESGPSGGLLMTLSIYDSLTKDDLTHGLKVGGTGTIDSLGNVGSISGLEYKIKGLLKDHIDVFFVPAGENYEEAKKIVAENHYDLNLVSVRTFDDAVQYLETIQKQ